jgi:hypothetical protein
MTRRFERFIGIDLGGGKGRHTAVARLESREDGRGVVVRDYGEGPVGLWFDESLLEFLHAPEQSGALVALNAPLTLPVCARCTLPVCPSVRRCDVPIVRWFREREATLPPAGAPHAGSLLDRVSDLRPAKPRYTPYTQRATDVLLAEEAGIQPRETLGQGMGPLAARGGYLRQALRSRFVLGSNLVEVSPKATVTRLFGERTAARYKRTADAAAVRLAILTELDELSFAPGAWREDGLSNDHKFDAVLAAFTGWLWAQGRCDPPPDETIAHDGWIWIPARDELRRRSA